MKETKNFGRKPKKKKFRRKPKILEGNQNINFGRKTKILEGNKKIWKENKNFRRKPKNLEGNQKFWEENKIKFWKETKNWKGNFDTSQPRPQSNSKKIALAPHDFAGNFYSF